MILFNEKKCIDICCKNSSKYVFRAIEDLRKDFERLSNGKISPQIVEDETDWCIIIEENAAAGCEAVEDESFRIKSEEGKVRISAQGYLGTMWGIYCFSEKVLGVSPCYLFDDYEIQPIDKLEISGVDIYEAPPAFGFRGVFINDEDLLTGWKTGGGVRYVDAPCYGVTLEQNVIEMVVETILRLRLNLVIPATFLDLSNPAEKMLADVIAGRGIFLSQHHVEPVGVSSFTFLNYCKAHGLHGEFSYREYPELMEEVWRAYAEKWAEYDNVVWQIGLRGKGDDRPIWQDDIPTEDVLKKSGEFITYALARQKDIIMNATDGKAKYFTSTLWMEGSKLMAKGLLEVPDNTITVFADNGPCQMFGPDFELVNRDRNNKYGIYYHVQYYSCGPHLAPLTGVDKLYYNVMRAYEKGDTSYFILNASNIREFTFELGAYSEMMWNPKSFSKEVYLEKHAAKYYGAGAEKATELIERYYEMIPSLDARKFCKHFQKYFNYDFGTDYGKIKNFTAKDGLVIEYASLLIENFRKEIDMELCDEMYAVTKRALNDYNLLYDDWKSLADESVQPLKKHIEVKWLCYTHIVKSLYEWYVNLYDAKKYYDLRQSEECKKSLNTACESLERLLEHRKCAEYGIFENWYRGDTKMNVKQHLYDTRGLLGQTPMGRR